RVDRVRALREALRVLRPGGWLFAAAISRYASLVDGLRGPLFDDSVFAAIVARDLAPGQHRNKTGNPPYFTTPFFPTPPASRPPFSTTRPSSPRRRASPGSSSWTS